MYATTQNRRSSSAPAWMSAPASDKQLAMLSRLCDERNVASPVGRTALTKGQASKLIDGLMAMPRAAKPVTTESGERVELDVGMYRTSDGVIAKVQKGQTGNLYAKRLVAIRGQRMSETDVVVGWEFEYAPGLVRSLRPEMRLSLEDAKAFGIRYGVCCVCGLTLKDAKSVAAGIGPVCVTKV
jgi:hypothetical protein